MPVPSGVSEVRASFPQTYYRSLLGESAAALPSLLYIQTQGAMPVHPYVPDTTLPVEARGWVAAGVDTGGQTFYALDEARAFADLGAHVTMVAQRFRRAAPVLHWYTDPSSGGWVDIVRVPAGGVRQGNTEYPFVPKENLYPRLAGMVEDVAAIGALRGAQVVVGGYADGGVIATAVGARLAIPVAFVPHSLGVPKMDNLGYDPRNPGHLFDPKFWFGHRLWAEHAALLGADVIFANTPDEPQMVASRYGVVHPRHVFEPPGVSEVFLEAGRDPDTLPEAARRAAGQLSASHDLQPGNFLMSWGRIVVAKNIPGEVRVLGELRRLAPETYGHTKLVIVGGNPSNPQGEELVERRNIAETMEEYGLVAGRDVVSIGDLTHDVIAALASRAMAYLGTQWLEPFGMSAAEMMALGGTGFVVVPEVAGFAKWLHTHGAQDAAVLLDLARPVAGATDVRAQYVEAARRIEAFRADPSRVRAGIRRGADLVGAQLRWSAIARRKLALFSTLPPRKAIHRPTLFSSTPIWYRSSAPVAAGDAMVDVSQQVASEVRGWINGDTGRPPIVAVRGPGAATLANLLWAALNRPDWHAARVAGEALALQRRRSRRPRATSTADEDAVEVASLLPPDTRVVVTDGDALPGGFPVDLHIYIGRDGHLGWHPHIEVHGEAVVVNAVPDFAARHTPSAAVGP